MSFSTLMVHLDPGQSNERLLQIAGHLAEQFNSRVVGITAGDVRPLYFLDGPAAQEILEKDQASLQTQMAECERKFRHALRGLADRIEWRCALERPARFVAREARAVDLIITSAKPGNIDSLREVGPGELVLQAGRPVLVVPQEVEWLRSSSVLVAWKDCREARRAICDALPLLHKARQVIVVELTESDSDRAAARKRIDDVATWLVR